MITNYKDSSKLVLAVDISEDYLDIVKKRYKNDPHVITKKINLEKLSSVAKKKIIQYNIDTIICINVLEHIQNDLEALKNMYDILSPQGKLLLFVPALPEIYGTIDKGFSHFRRYTKEDIKTKILSAGFKITSTQYFNFAGIIWWYIMGRLLKKNNIPKMTGNLLNIFVPILTKVESVFSPPIGQSLIAIAEKRQIMKNPFFSATIITKDK